MKPYFAKPIGEEMGILTIHLSHHRFAAGLQHLTLNHSFICGETPETRYIGVLTGFRH